MQLSHHRTSERRCPEEPVSDHDVPDQPRSRSTEVAVEVHQPPFDPSPWGLSGTTALRSRSPGRPTLRSGAAKRTRRESVSTVWSSSQINSLGVFHYPKQEAHKFPGVAEASVTSENPYLESGAVKELHEYAGCVARIGFARSFNLRDSGIWYGTPCFFGTNPKSGGCHDHWTRLSPIVVPSDGLLLCSQLTCFESSR
jgi:hypothetical protein